MKPATLKPSFATKTIVDDTIKFATPAPTWYDRINDIIYVRSFYDQDTDPEGWMVYSKYEARKRLMEDTLEPYPKNLKAELCFIKQFTYIKTNDIAKGLEDVYCLPTMRWLIQYDVTISVYWNLAWFHERGPSR